jgi:D-3-phosphoglycerate dehydrogenase
MKGESSMTSPSIACSGPVLGVAVEILKPFGNIVVADDSSEDALLQILEGAVGLVLRGNGVGSARVIETATDLKMIGRSGMGYDNVNIQSGRCICPLR